MELSNTVEKILGILTNLAVEEFWLGWGLESDLKSLQRSLSSINAVLQDAEEQRATSHRLSLWLRQLKHVLYDAEDVLDDFAYQLLRKQVVNTHGGIKRKVRRVFSSNNSMLYRLRIGHRVKDIKQRLAEIDANKNAFNLAANLQAHTGHDIDWLKDREMTGSFVNASDIIGRDADRETIVKLLMDSHGQDIQVVPIVGMGGLGKTALTKMIFNDQRVEEHFGSKVWVCLGDIKEFSVNRAMINIVKSLGVNNFNTQHMQDVIRGKFQNKRFLLILDDMWDANRSSWLELKTLLACGTEGSKIVVTTRINSVALCVGTVSAHDLKGLPQVECILLFKKFAFASEGEVDHHLMKIGEQIVSKCKGVPLAVRNMGSALYNERDERKWSLARDNGIWQMVEAHKNILPILKYSYDQLCSHLKQCFLFCLVFPEDHEFNGFDLISCWMAHGLLHAPKKKLGEKENPALQPEHVGKLYIKELVSRGFFQEFEDMEQIECSLKMHDLVRDLACSLVGEEFAVVNGNDKNICENARHVWVSEAQCFSPESSNVLQTVLVPYVGFRANTAFAEACITKFKHLRVLGLGGSEFEELPKSIGTLKHLRSLDLRFCRRLKRLPNFVCKLHNLQTLLLGGCLLLEELPNRMGELMNLRRLEVTTKQKQLPKNGIERLTSLQYLSLQGCSNLETIFDPTQVHLLTSLETLWVWGCERLIYLFDKSSSCSTSYCLPALEVLMLQECPNLNLNSIAGQQQEQDDDSAVSPPCLQLPSLRVLSLINMRGLEAWPECFQGYENTLQTLDIGFNSNLRALPEWLPNVTSLRTITIRLCGLLESLPRGMERLTALNKLEIIYCGELSKRCKESQGEDWPMIAHVPHIRIS